jgi:hypothetical protein
MKSTDHFKFFCWKRLIFLSACSLFGFCSHARAELRAWSGNAELSTVGSPEDSVLWNFRPGLGLKWEPSFSLLPHWSLGLEGRIRADSQSEFAASGRQFDARVDRAVLQWIGSEASLSAGWQKFTWGDSAFLDGVDVLNARDLTEPVYTDDELLKIAVPSVSLQYLAGNTVFQAVMIVQPSRSPVPTEAAGVNVNAPEPLRPGDVYEFGLKAGGLLKNGWDINGYLASHLERIPQAVLVQDPLGLSVRLFEPRVFTLGVTATQSAGDVVVRSEMAFHFNRALPQFGLAQEATANQMVGHVTADFTLFSDLILTGELWAEKWSEASSDSFKNTSSLLGARLQKSLWSQRADTSLGFLSSASVNESLLTAGFTWKFLDAWQWNIDAYRVQTSKGHSLARRQLKNLINSTLKFQF